MSETYYSIVNLQIVAVEETDEDLKGRWRRAWDRSLGNMNLTVQ